jgi:hypothetical protein
MVKGGMSIDLVVGRVEELPLFVGCGSNDGMPRYHPDARSLVPSGIDIPSVLKGHLRIGGVYAPNVFMRGARFLLDENLPKRPLGLLFALLAVFLLILHESLSFV